MLQSDEDHSYSLSLSQTEIIGGYITVAMTVVFIKSLYTCNFLFTYTQKVLKSLGNFSKSNQMTKHQSFGGLLEWHLNFTAPLLQVFFFFFKFSGISSVYKHIAANIFHKVFETTSNLEVMPSIYISSLATLLSLL